MFGIPWFWGGADLRGFGAVLVFGLLGFRVEGVGVQVQGLAGLHTVCVGMIRS